MKKSLLTLAVVGLTAASSFAQGYFVFAGAKSTVFDVNTPSASTVSSGSDYVGFLIGAAGISFTSATSTNINTQGSWSPLSSSSLASSGFSWATVAGTPVSVLTSTPTLARGGWSYNGGASFALDNAPASTTFTIVPVAWASAGGANPTILGNSAYNVGWGNAVQYTSGTILSTLGTVGAAGVLPFGVAPVPEPTSFALAGIGAAAMMIFRRKK